ncbi:hypothetical protein Scep_022948 [Stephania cephalantha]|uniref:Uncharacterized protein n=1 Tax=Stephania cephalantha TaxID=152367 RepID=A0AAP0FJH8_9MAGN
MLVYDITRRPTFENLPKWIEELRHFGDPEIVIVLCGNKSDLAGHGIRQVDEREGRTLAERERIWFMETSALANLNVEEAFLHMITQIHDITVRKNLDAKVRGDCDRAIAPGGRKVILNGLDCDDDEVSATKHSSCTSCIN